MRKAAYLLHLITDVQLGWVKEQQDEVAACSKPAADLYEVVCALQAHTSIRNPDIVRDLPTLGGMHCS